MTYFASDLLISIVRHFDDAGLRYLVLRNYESLPCANDSKDVDILLNSADMACASRTVLEAAARNGYELVWKTHVDYLTNFIFLKKINDDFYTIKIDLFRGFLWRGLSYLNDASFLREYLMHEGLKIPSPEFEAAGMILYYILYAGSVPEKYRDKIFFRAGRDSGRFLDVLQSSFSAGLSHSIATLLESNDWAGISSLRRRICFEIVKNNLSISLPLVLFVHACLVVWVFRNPFRWIKNRLVARKKNEGNKPLFDLLGRLGVNESGYSLLKPEFFKYL